MLDGLDLVIIQFRCVLYFDIVMSIFFGGLDFLTAQNQEVSRHRPAAEACGDEPTLARDQFFVFANDAATFALGHPSASSMITFASPAIFPDKLSPSPPTLFACGHIQPAPSLVSQHQPNFVVVLTRGGHQYPPPPAAAAAPSQQSGSVLSSHRHLRNLWTLIVAPSTSLASLFFSPVL